MTLAYIVLDLTVKEKNNTYRAVVLLLFVDVDVSSGFYSAVLEMIDRFFDGDIDQQVFEEQTRYIFVTDAYLIFTIDKLVHSMIKQVHKQIDVICISCH